jgi:hypothetical protein
MLKVVEKPELRSLRNERLVLKSTPLIQVTGLLHWARDGYAVARATDEPVAPYIQVFADGYRLGALLSERLLREEIPVSYDGDDLVLSLSEEEYRTYVVRQASLPDVPGGLVEAVFVERGLG